MEEEWTLHQCVNLAENGCEKLSKGKRNKSMVLTVRNCKLCCINLLRYCEKKLQIISENRARTEIQKCEENLLGSCLELILGVRCGSNGVLRGIKSRYARGNSVSVGNLVLGYLRVGDG